MENKAKKRVLFITSGFDKIGANSLCVNNIVDELVRKNYEVYVLCDLIYPNNNISERENVHIVRLENGPYKRSNFTDVSVTSKLFGICKKFLFYSFGSFCYPNVYPFYTHKVFNKAKEIILSSNIEIVVGTYQKTSSLKAAIKIKKKFNSQIYSYSWHIDVLQKNNVRNNLLSTYKRMREKNFISKEIKIMDKLLFPTGIKDRYCNSKVVYTHLPVFQPQNVNTICDSSFQFDPSTINISYIGSLDNENRNPHYLFKLIGKIGEIKNKPVCIHLWGNIPAKIIDNESPKCMLCYHGVVDNSYVIDILRKSDFVLNVSNKVFYNMVPSKIFTLFVADRPIINFIQNENDITKSYFLGNENIINVSEDCDSKLVQHSLSAFLNDKYGSQLNYDLSLFEQNKPSFFVDQMGL